MSASEQVNVARERGFYAVIEGDDPAVGMANLGALHVFGPDAGAFLHGQVTNDVQGLEEGAGNLSARVKRTGHLVEIFSLHRLPSEGGLAHFLLVGERQGIATLQADLDAFLFVEKVDLHDVSDALTWVILQGPETPKIIEEILLDEGIEQEVIYQPGMVLKGSGLEGDGYFLARSLTGDPGFLCAVPSDLPAGARVLGRLTEVASGAGLPKLGGSELGAVLEVLRLEAGFVRMAVDMPGKMRLLPETGLEQQLVSYTKGCYLGQEVIARVRTYGSVPQALRGLILQPEQGASADDLLRRVPPLGENLVVKGKAVGQFLSRVYSPALDAPLVWAYIHRDHRTPGAEITFEAIEGSLRAKVVLLPAYRTLEEQERVPGLYDLAIRQFADGDEAGAIHLLEEVLRLDPTFADAYEVVGVIFARTGRFHEAIDVFQRLAEVAPDEPMVDTNLSIYYMKLGDKATAEEHSARALQKNLAMVSGTTTTAAAMAESQAKQRKEEALRKKGMFEQVLAFDPEDSIALFGVGNALCVLEDWEGAAEYLGKAAAADKNNSAIFLAHGKALEKLERAGEALGIFRKGMEVASRRGDLMPLNEMQQRVLLLEAMTH